MHGFLNINKPEGMTSYDVIRKIKPLLPHKTKIGHLGTLDPMAGGVLPLALGSATRVIPFIKNEDKTYLATVTLGAVSDTLDAWGQVRYTDRVSFQEKDLRSILKEFTGNIKQLPPMYSAVHHQGQRLYELARQGINVNREEREVVINSIELLDINRQLDLPAVKIRVDCSKGTYIRTLCDDIGRRLGTGALLSNLVRIRSGDFTIEQSYLLEELVDRTNIEEYLLSIDYPISGIPALSIESPQDIDAILNGRMIKTSIQLPDGMVRVYTNNHKLLALALSTGNNEQTLIKPERVFK
ncbi:MAG: tRNA pseudouridine(55) synthase TruB [Syntrophomonadaceae bacterium]|nr:tRNA pseudouridine(55) synthase TruB [Syntrophomonadaceae bacterium]